ncbi:MAG: hypothetical protein K2O16_20220 [Lachnospiraceae bacterium]|nr:hypothetical protein [Lachnospiraceae bacterium]
MDERENIRESDTAESRKENPGRGKKILLAAVIFIVAVAGAALYMIASNLPPKGYKEYTVQKEQYFVEYSDEYDYGEVLTIEYPCLTGIEEEMQGRLNTLMYDAAMDRTNYWHFFPSDEVKEFQREHFTFFCSDVNCDVAFHSQYLLSMNFEEIYCTGNPVWMTNLTERTLTVDLLTGQSYELSDILEINSDFIRLWDRVYSEEVGDELGSDETIEMLLSWFLKEDAQLNEVYQFRPSFYVTEDKNFVIGIFFDPILEKSITYEPTYRGFKVEISAEDLEPFRKESEFWDKYDKSETAGEVLPCQEKKENLWLGEGAGIWDWEY